MKILILRSAVEDLSAGRAFYAVHGSDLGEYFLDCLSEDIASLLITRGAHRRVFGFYRLLSTRFPFAVYYDVEENTIKVWRILDCRADPGEIREQLRRSR